MESQSAPTPSSLKWSMKFHTRVVSGRLPDMKLQASGFQVSPAAKQAASSSAGQNKLRGASQHGPE